MGVAKPTKVLVDELAALPQLRGIEPDDLEWLLGRCAVCTVPQAEVLLDPAQENATAYIILSGRLEVLLVSANEETHTYLEAGNWVGEMSIIEGSVTSATVITDTDCRLLAIPGDVLWSLIDRSHAVARNLLHSFSARVRRDNEIIAEGVRQQQVFAQHAQTDFLSGLWNRRWLDERLSHILERCRIDDQSLSLMMLDIDHFKDYNDANGHLAGDIALQTVANAIRENLRPSDFAVRYGGEEFVVIMPNTEAHDALKIAERLGAIIRNLQIKAANGTPLPKVTASMGLASQKSGEKNDRLLEEADAAMYRAKRAGRDRVAA